MREIISNLYVGNQEDFENTIFLPYEWSFVLAAKEPWHRQTLGYTGRAAPRDHPEYLIARRDDKLILNLVDAPKSIFFNKDVIDAGLDFIKEELNKGKKVLVCCNQGESRSPSIALLYLVKYKYIDVDTLEDAEAEFLKLYPEYNPGEGIRSFVKENWDYYNVSF